MKESKACNASNTVIYIFTLKHSNNNNNLFEKNNRMNGS